MILSRSLEDLELFTSVEQDNSGSGDLEGIKTVDSVTKIAKNEGGCMK